METTNFCDDKWEKEIIMVQDFIIVIFKDWLSKVNNNKTSTDGTNILKILTEWNTHITFWLPDILENDNNAKEINYIFTVIDDLTDEDILKYDHELTLFHECLDTYYN